MYCDCHMHMVLDGVDWRAAIARHSNGVDEDFIRRTLETYQELGFSYLRDGGDRWGVSGQESWPRNTVFSTALLWRICASRVTTAASSEHTTPISGNILPLCGRPGPTARILSKL